MSSYKPNPCKATLRDAIEDAYSILYDLHGQAQEIVDNASEGLSQTQRVQTFGETADALNGADSAPDVPDSLAEMPINYVEMAKKSKRRGPSRATQCSNACSALDGCISALDEWLEVHKDDEGDAADLVAEAESLRDEISGMKDTAEGCEFPGMYG